MNYDVNIPCEFLRILVRKLNFTSDDTLFPGAHYHNRRDLMKFPKLGDASLHRKSIKPIPVPALKNARKKGFFADRERKQWTEQELEEVEKQKMDYCQSFLDLGHDKRLFAKIGDKLPTRPIGPHTIASFTTEWRAYLMRGICGKAPLGLHAFAQPLNQPIEGGHDWRDLPWRLLDLYRTERLESLIPQGFSEGSQRAAGTAHMNQG